jgi:hypothetical protein
VNRRELIADDPLQIGDIILIPVAEVSSFSNVKGEMAAFAARKRAKAVVALGPQGAVALSLDGAEISLSELADKVSGLDELMAEIRGSEVEDKG